jgi:hypothetical protein
MLVSLAERLFRLPAGVQLFETRPDHAATLLYGKCSIG